MRQADRLAPGLLRGRVVPGHHRRAAQRRVHHRGHRQGARRRRAGRRAPARATARSTPSTPPCARPSAPRYPALDRVHLTDYKVRVLDTGQGTGAVTRVLLDSTDGERTWSHHRREREHHRGVVAGPVRLDRLRPAPHAGPTGLTEPTCEGTGCRRWLPLSTCPCRRSPGPAATSRPTTCPTPGWPTGPAEVVGPPARRRPARVPGARPGLRPQAGRRGAQAPLAARRRASTRPTPSRAASASPCGGPRCSGGRR